MIKDYKHYFRVLMGVLFLGVGLFIYSAVKTNRTAEEFRVRESIANERVRQADSVANAAREQIELLSATADSLDQVIRFLTIHSDSILTVAENDIGQAKLSDRPIQYDESDSTFLIILRDVYRERTGAEWDSVLGVVSGYDAIRSTPWATRRLRYSGDCNRPGVPPGTCII